MAAGRTATPLGPAGTQSLDPGAGMWVGVAAVCQEESGLGWAGRRGLRGDPLEGSGEETSLCALRGQGGGRETRMAGPGWAEDQVAGRGRWALVSSQGGWVWGLRLGAESGQEEVQASPAPVTVENTPRVRSLGRDGGPGRVQRSRPGSAPCPAGEGPRGRGATHHHVASLALQVRQQHRGLLRARPRVGTGCPPLARTVPAPRVRSRPPSLPSVPSPDGIEAQAALSP